MKRMLIGLTLAATLFLIPGAPEAKATSRPPVLDGGECSIEYLVIAYNADGSYSLTIGESCDSFGLVCQYQYDRDGNQINAPKCTFVT